MSESPSHHVLVVGVGSIGERHLRCFQGTGRSEVTLVEINPALRQAVAERYNVRGYASLEEALATKPTAAVVAVPAHLHLKIASQLAQAGVHLLIEKPLSTSTQGVKELSELVARQQIVCGVAYVYRSHPVLGAMREAIASGRFGQPVELVAVCGQHFPTYRPAYREIYYKDRATGGGAIQDALTHILNAGEWLVGPMSQLVADAEHQLLPGVEVEDTVHLLARHGRVLASYALNQHQAPNETIVTVVCERGTVRFEGHESRWRWQTTPGDSWHDETFPPLERDTLFIEQAKLFLDAVERKRPVTCSLDAGAATLRANLAALASCESRAWQNLKDECA
ncbi:putative oxidoreductase YdgJ [Anatilimnocola aggregata]|uniref:Putative oxidoreductase YdgJ n=1 Tax=Anatilimnocola aggregata TaxID=2528021 RepID=A0A517YNC7_9BACT|nr:Gfo/Idh/MocA family oxidoreductase [Anatilimnocola aggregata]QDU31727.1 putative oxidoreductase YdgJ [Anatilimnocola aggregata]